MSYKGEAAHPSAPTVAKVRMRFAKRGRARFSSHRDVARAMEWALRRAGVPVSLSQGFSPHPRLSWIGAAPTGAASEAEFVEIGLTRDLEPEALGREVGAVLPEGVVVLDVVRAGPGALADRIDGSAWRIEMPGVDPTDLRAAVAALLAREAVEVERMTKNGPRMLDVRSALVALDVMEPLGERHPDDERTSDDPGPTRPDASTDRRTHARSAVCGTLSTVVRHTTPVVRPDDVVSALRTVAGLEPPVPVKATRTAQGRLDDTGVLLDPLEVDRDPIGR
ncbi:TIGR03936 family radical SAM-associated protein [Actinomycetospora termitidis]|uniref:TIGR03936 family radical SAM-associated protein n=1 Tax=Actinomycetospora termitidis TaxID=3053470 RepID=A0ABT7MJ38_9PSEU|nr:TIGR03936 family radical SAM-associated protein [Actinomycetospora sp. Odt1-22]MDL5160002.1 TIGR03936 family radical SAM-associated protein [Actinomycetospora sp. Odt1-22]